MKILIAENNVVSALYLKELLEQYNAEVEIVPDGISAYKAAISNNYDLIFMDYKMPDMNGIEATKRIKIDLNRLGKPSTFIVACCTPDDPEKKKRMEQIGCRKYNN